jgi:hypothetical protein
MPSSNEGGTVFNLSFWPFPLGRDGQLKDAEASAPRAGGHGVTDAPLISTEQRELLHELLREPANWDFADRQMVGHLAGEVLAAFERTLHGRSQ